MSIIEPNRETIPIFVNQAGAGTSAIFRPIGGTYYLLVQGTLGGATVQLQYLSEDDTTYLNLGNAIAAVDSANTPPGPVQIALTQNRYRATITAGGTGVYVSLRRL